MTIHLNDGTALAYTEDHQLALNQAGIFQVLRISPLADQQPTIVASIPLPQVKYIDHVDHKPESQLIDASSRFGGNPA